ncbi:MAG: UDP-3-O-(3-hydroxymyristoyl)glucosamine N-acyltransferase [Phycisphaerae bacterium]|nr:UDP-3-O-(3-hydroxymyristoyl)glucosamine N-acyltransferase [Phycisphaerae bacterium]
MAETTLQQLAEHTGGRVVGDGATIITSAATLEQAQPGQITFLNNNKYLPLLKTTRAGAVIVGEELESVGALLVAKDPYYAFMQAVVLLHGHRPHKPVGMSPLAQVAPDARLGDNCHVHNFATICEGVIIGNNCHIYPGVFVGPGVRMGDDCIIYPNAVIYDGSVIGSRVIVQSNASIGQDGYGFATHSGRHHKIPQIGRAVIEDDVEIGAGSAIERGTLDDTVIGAGSKIGDMVTVGHGAKIGPHCLLVPQVGIAGSAAVGHHCMLGGQVGIVGHVKIGNLVKIGAQAGVINDLPDGASVFGAPAIEADKARRAYALIEYLPEMRKRIRKIEKRLDHCEISD